MRCTLASHRYLLHPLLIVCRWSCAQSLDYPLASRLFPRPRGSTRFTQSLCVQIAVTLFTEVLYFSFNRCAMDTAVAVMRRSRSRASILVLLPHLLSASYFSCIIETSCKQTLLLAFLEARTSTRTHQNNTQYFVFIAFSTLQSALQDESTLVASLIRMDILLDGADSPLVAV
jgi:hypothetical protein